MPFPDFSQEALWNFYWSPSLSRGSEQLSPLSKRSAVCRLEIAGPGQFLSPLKARGTPKSLNITNRHNGIKFYWHTRARGPIIVPLKQLI